MNRNRIQLFVALSLLLGATSFSPAQAQFSWTLWQTPVSRAEIMADEMERNLINSFQSSLIDEWEFAMYRQEIEDARDQQTWRRLRNVAHQINDARTIKKLKRIQAQFDFSVTGRK